MSPNKSVYAFEPSSNNSSPASQSSREDVQTDAEFVDQQLFFVTSYSDFDKLAHGPRGHGAKHTIRVYKFQTDGSLVLLHISGECSQVINPAFSRFHPR
jgi:6-phosphogluconolactonase